MIEAFAVQGQTFIRNHMDTDERLARVVGTGESFPLVQSFLEQGYRVELGTPLEAFCSKDNLNKLAGGNEGEVSAIVDSVFRHVYTQDDVNGGWHEATVFDLQNMHLQNCMHRFILMLAQPISTERDAELEAISTEMAGIMLVSPLLPYMALYRFSPVESAMVIGMIGDPRWFKEGRKSLLNQYFNIEQDHKVMDTHSPFEFRRQVLQSMVMADTTGVTPFSRNTVGEVAALMENLASTGDKKEYIRLMMSVTSVLDGMLRMVLKYISKVWLGLVCPSKKFRPDKFFSHKDDIEFFNHHMK